MKKAKISVFLVLALAGVVVGLAQGHEAKALTLTCGASSAHFESFPSGTNTISVRVYRDGVSFYSTTASFVGSSGDVAITFDSTGEFYWKVVYSWTVDGGGSKEIAKQMLCTAPCHCTTPTVTVTTTAVSTTTVASPPPPPEIRTVTTTLPPSPPVTVTTTTPAPPARTVTVTKTIKAKPPKARVVYRDRVRTKVVTRVVHSKKRCVCAPGSRLYHGRCAPIVPGQG
jgi:hypothetical protein